MVAELAGLLRAGVPERGIHLTCASHLVTGSSGDPGAREVSDAVEAMVRAACRLVRELDASDELVEPCCRAAWRRCEATAARAPAGFRKRRAPLTPCSTSWPASMTVT